MSFVESQLFTTHSNILLLLEGKTSMDSFSFSFLIISNNNLFYSFRFKETFHAYADINAPITKLENLESLGMDMIFFGLKSVFLKLAKFTVYFIKEQIP